MKMNPTKNDSSPTLLKIRRHSNGRDNRETHRAEFEMRVGQIDGLSHIVKMPSVRLCCVTVLGQLFVLRGGQYQASWIFFLLLDRSSIATTILCPQS